MSAASACAIVTGDINQAGGMNRANAALATHLALAGSEVHLVAHEADAELLSLGRVFFHRVPKVARSYTLSLPLLDRAGRRWARHCAELGGRAVVNGGNCVWGDINWVHYVHAAWTPCDIDQGMTKRIRASWLHQRFRRLEAAAVGAARVVITNSQRTSRDVIERLRVPESRVRCVYLGVDPNVFCPADASERAALRRELGWPDDRPQAIFVGALGDSRKGLDLALDAWRRLPSSWDVDLNVAGAGRDLPRWRRLIGSSSEIRASVRFLGFRQDVDRLLKASDVMIAPARYEPYGLNVHEALCCGVPALTGRSAGVAERYDAELADLLIPDVRDVADLADRVRGWRGRLEHYRTRTAVLGERLRRYTWEDMAKDFVAAVEETTQVPPPAPAAPSGDVV